MLGIGPRPDRELEHHSRQEVEVDAAHLQLLDSIMSFTESFEVLHLE